MNITLYTTHCPKCEILKRKLESKSIAYATCDNIDEIIKIGEANNIMSAPILNADGIYMDYGKAVKWTNEQN